MPVPKDEFADICEGLASQQNAGNGETGIYLQSILLIIDDASDLDYSHKAQAAANYLVTSRAMAQSAMEKYSFGQVNKYLDDLATINAYLTENYPHILNSGRAILARVAQQAPVAIIPKELFIQTARYFPGDGFTQAHAETLAADPDAVDETAQAEAAYAYLMLPDVELRFSEKHRIIGEFIMQSRPEALARAEAMLAHAANGTNRTLQSPEELAALAK